MSGASDRTALISIIGPPAVGKTTLAENLAKELPAELIREDYAGNPFLAESYVGCDEARLPGQLYFLMSRVGQLAIAGWPARGLFISDYGFCQDRIFAGLRLGDDDLRMYERVARRVEGLVRPPDVLIHLDADEPVLLERIARRGRQFESVMNLDFLRAIRRMYDQAQDAGICPVIRVDCGRTDLREAQARSMVLERIRQALDLTSEVREK